MLITYVLVCVLSGQMAVPVTQDRVPHERGPLIVQDPVGERGRIIVRTLLEHSHDVTTRAGTPRASKAPVSVPVAGIPCNQAACTAAVLPPNSVTVRATRSRWATYGPPPAYSCPRCACSAIRRIPAIPTR